ncbi:MAG: hypothetical protein RI562_06220 [Salibacter sp.]|uniref:hypothetical protein n=1 Tax=Salibacter sp. TaxID=2010995 RepID=UPI00287086DD|nr:hypothetical protein [Salibacter sp.]MDR9398640.1 hypothetical protein [Salibacter sp.]
MSITTEYSLWLIIGCIALAALYTYLLYSPNKSTKPFSKTAIWALSAFRFISVFVLSFLLLNPLLKTTVSESEKARVVVAVDNSQSIVLNKDSNFFKNQFRSDLENFITKLQDRYQVEKLAFGGEVSELQSADSLNYSEPYTNHQSVIENVDETHGYSNLGALIVATDGLTNKGRNPLYYQKTNNFPIYTVGLGDSSRQRDVLIRKVRHNELAFLGNTFPVEVMAAANDFEGNDVKVEVTQNGNVLKSKTFSVSKPNDFKSFEFQLEAKEPGVQKYTVSLSQLDGELTYVNNTREFYIEVIDNRSKILFVSSAPHPDIGAMIRSLKPLENYELQTHLAISDEELPNLEQFQLVIASNIFSKEHNDLRREIIESELPVLWHGGLNLSAGNMFDIGMGMELSRVSNQLSDVTASPGNQFDLFEISEKFNERIESFPPLKMTFGNYNSSSGLSTLYYQQVGNVVTDQPLVAFRSGSDRKQGILLGDGLYRWRLFDYAQNGDAAAFDELIRKSVQFLLTKEDKSRFRLSYENQFSIAQRVEIGASLYDPSYELTNEPDVELTINRNGEEVPYKMSRRGDRYVLDLGFMEPGEYSFTAATALAGDQFSRSGKFTVKSISVESQKTRADFGLLMALADRNNGDFHSARQLDRLADELLAKDFPTVAHKHDEYADVIELEWLFFVILLLLTAEWATRKYQGGY